MTRDVPGEHGGGDQARWLVTVAHDKLMRNAVHTAFWMALTAIPAACGFAAVIFDFGVNSVADYAVGIVVGVGFSWLTYRIWRAGLRVSEDGAVITRPVKRRTVVPLTSISAFEVGWNDPQYSRQSDHVSVTPYVVLRRREGAVLPIWALAIEGRGSRWEDHADKLQAMCDGLNALVSRLQGYEDPTRSPAV